MHFGAAIRELRGPVIRLAQCINLNPNLTLAEKWRDLENSYPLEPNGRILKFGDRLEE